MHFKNRFGGNPVLAIIGTPARLMLHVLSGVALWGPLPETAGFVDPAVAAASRLASGSKMASFAGSVTWCLESAMKGYVS